MNGEQIDILIAFSIVVSIISFIGGFVCTLTDLSSYPKELTITSIVWDIIFIVAAVAIVVLAVVKAGM